MEILLPNRRSYKSSVYSCKKLDTYIVTNFLFVKNSDEVDISNLKAFVTERQGTNREWSKIMYNRTSHETLRQNRLNYTNVAVGN